MIYAYQRTQTSVELYASESDKPAPDGYTTCTLDGWIAAWQLRDNLHYLRMRRSLCDPYEAELCRVEA